MKKMVICRSIFLVVAIIILAGYAVNAACDLGDGVSRTGTLKTQEFKTAGSGQFVVPAGVTKIKVEVIGAGGGGGDLSKESEQFDSLWPTIRDYCTADGVSGGSSRYGGGGGGYAKIITDVIPGKKFNYVVGEKGFNIDARQASYNCPFCCYYGTSGKASSFGDSTFSLQGFGGKGSTGWNDALTETDSASRGIGGGFSLTEGGASVTISSAKGISYFYSGQSGGEGRTRSPENCEPWPNDLQGYYGGKSGYASSVAGSWCSYTQSSFGATYGSGGAGDDDVDGDGYAGSNGADGAVIISWCEAGSTPITPPENEPEAPLASSCSNDQIIFKLLSEQNSHVSQWNNPDASVAICYDAVFGSEYDVGADPDYRTCKSANSNTILRTYGDGANNTHAEDPTGTTSGYFPVCYGDLQCQLKTSGEACQANSRIVSYLSAPTNAHVSKLPIDGGYKLCCGDASTVCNNNGVKDVGEECDGDGVVCTASDGSQGTCSSCSCIVTEKEQEIKLAEWRDPTIPDGFTEDSTMTKAGLNSLVQLYGEAEGYTEDDMFQVDVYDVRDVYNLPLKTILDVRFADGKMQIHKRSVITVNAIEDADLTLGELVQGVEVGMNLTFKISHFDEDFNVDNSLMSAELEVVEGDKSVILVDNCDLIEITEDLSEDKAEELCLKAESNSKLIDALYCVNGETNAKCAWNEDNKTCYNKVTLKSPSGDVGTCSYTVDYSNAPCGDDGYRAAKIITNYDGDEVCSGDCKASSSLSKIPCGRSFLTLPFFTAWQIVGAVIVLFFIYLILVKTGVFGKNSKKCVKKKR